MAQGKSSLPQLLIDIYCTLTLTLYPLSKRVPVVLGWEPGKEGKRVPWDSLGCTPPIAIPCIKVSVTFPKQTIFGTASNHLVYKMSYPRVAATWGRWGTKSAYHDLEM